MNDTSLDHKKMFAYIKHAVNVLKITVTHEINMNERFHMIGLIMKRWHIFNKFCHSAYLMV